MPSKKDKAEAVAEVKRLTDYVDIGGEQLEGERIKIEDILGDDIKLLDFVLLPSKMGEEGDKFLVLQFEHKATVCVTTTGAAQVVAAIGQMPKQYLPVMVCVIKDYNEKTKRNFYRVE